MEGEFASGQGFVDSVCQFKGSRACRQNCHVRVAVDENFEINSDIRDALGLVDDQHFCVGQHFVQDLAALGSKRLPVNQFICIDHLTFAQF